MVPHDPVMIFVRLSRMFRVYCRFFHGSADKKRFRPAGIVSRWLGGSLQDDERPILCRSCREHLILALIKKMTCRQGGRIPCSLCDTPCSSAEHRRTMRNIMLFRVLVLLLTFQWKPILEHLLKPSTR